MTNFVAPNKKLKQGVRMYQPPFGYDLTEEGNLIPLENDLTLLGEVKELLDTNSLSLRDAAFYLTMKASRSISHEGLRKRLNRPVYIEDVSITD